MSRHWSAQQEAIFGWFANSGDGFTPRTGFAKPIEQTIAENNRKKNAVVRARAGTGKTTTIIEGITRAPEKAILLAAFNKRIQVELSEKITNPNAEALTLHSVGYRAVRRYWEKIGIDNRGQRAIELAEKVCGEQAPDAIKRLVSKLGTKLREGAPFVQPGDDITGVALQFDCVPDEAWEADGYTLDYVCEKAIDTLAVAAATKPVKTGIDFADMLFLPIYNKWLQPMYDLVVVDEAQDMTLVQLLLAQGVCKGRFCVVGDDRQAIYGFRGADSGSLDRLKAELDAEEFGLNVTYRCGQAIVADAQRLVPDYQAHESNGPGHVARTELDPFYKAVKPGDFVLSRMNAPLVTVALTLIRRGTRAKIEGRDIGAGLKAIVKKLAVGPARSSTPAFLERLANWLERETLRAEKLGNENKVAALVDQYETLVALADGVTGIPELEARLETLFADVAAQGAPSQVVCSSVHRAKGLETEAVWMLAETFNPPVACVACRKRPKTCRCLTGYQPDPMAQREEQNIEYVAITRAKDQLFRVTGIKR